VGGATGSCFGKFDPEAGESVSGVLIEKARVPSVWLEVEETRRGKMGDIGAVAISGTRRQRFGCCVPVVARCSTSLGIDARP
jgi:hypothetical protein